MSSLNATYRDIKRAFKYACREVETTGTRFYRIGKRIGKTIAKEAERTGLVIYQTGGRAIRIAEETVNDGAEGSIIIFKYAYQFGKRMGIYASKKSKPILDTLISITDVLEQLAHPSSAVLPGFKRSMQCDNYSCGAQCAYMILHYYGKARSIDNVENEVCTTEDGTEWSDIISLFRKRGLIIIFPRKHTIMRIIQAIDNGCPVLVGVDNSNHYAVVFGYGDKEIFVADPSIKRSLFCAHSTRHFLKRWDRDAMIVEKPAK